MRRRDEEVQRLRESVQQLQGVREEPERQERQLSLSNNFLSRGEGGANILAGEEIRVGLGFKLKPDTFDGTIPLREFLLQFNFIADANSWSRREKALALVSCLRGKARSVLESLENFDRLEFDELVSKLELRFGEGLNSINSYSLFTNRRQKFGEDFAAYGAELERLARLAYPECPFAVRDKIACAQFVSALADGYVRRTLQLEGVNSLKLAIERAKAVKIIQGDYSSFGRRSGYMKTNQRANFGKQFASGKEKEANNEKKGNLVERKNGREGENFKGKAYGKECWSCGKEGHFRFECPGAQGNAE
jgi:hypothetical protein